MNPLDRNPLEKPGLEGLDRLLEGATEGELLKLPATVEKVADVFGEALEYGKDVRAKGDVGTAMSKSAAPSLPCERARQL